MLLFLALTNMCPILEIIVQSNCGQQYIVCYIPFFWVLGHVAVFHTCGTILYYIIHTQTSDTANGPHRYTVSEEALVRHAHLDASQGDKKRVAVEKPGPQGRSPSRASSRRVGLETKSL